MISAADQARLDLLKLAIEQINNTSIELRRMRMRIMEEHFNMQRDEHVFRKSGAILGAVGGLDAALVHMSDLLRYIKTPDVSG